MPAAAASGNTLKCCGVRSSTLAVIAGRHTSYLTLFLSTTFRESPLLKFWPSTTDGTATMPLETAKLFLSSTNNTPMDRGIATGAACTISGGGSISVTNSCPPSQWHSRCKGSRRGQASTGTKRD
ncbi:hypothetical protein Mapa_008930 [Marchantia paleacea]|nr:hypothetical protein Mapa_008930 [Marchantia paleacea]